MKFRLLDMLLPRETKFFTYLDEQAGVIIEASQSFKDFVDSIDNLSDVDFKRRIAAIKELERKGDAVERRIIDELHNTFITPIDREDIYTITTTMDKALDILNSITQKFDAYNIRVKSVDVQRFAEVILAMSLDLRLLFSALANKKDIMLHVDKMHADENLADQLFHSAMAELFKGGYAPVEIIKFKEVYEHLEGVTDCIDYVGKLVRGVKVKLG